MNTDGDLNPGRDLCAEARQIVLDAVAAAEADPDDKGISLIFEAVDSWVGGTDQIFGMLGNGMPIRPQSVFDGVSAALDELDPTTLKVHHTMALISITSTVASRVPGRASFVKRAYAHYLVVRPDDVDALFEGYLA